jgi:hypothetical protein
MVHVIDELHHIYDSAKTITDSMSPLQSKIDLLVDVMHGVLQETTDMFLVKNIAVIIQRCIRTKPSKRIAYLNAYLLTDIERLIAYEYHNMYSFYLLY